VSARGTPWACEVGEPEYLDGIRSGVSVYDEERRPVAYAFDAAEGQLLASAPDLLEALKEAEELLLRSMGFPESWECSEDELLGDIRKAIAKAEAGQ